MTHGSISDLVFEQDNLIGVLRKMDEALYKAVVTNDRPAFLGLVQENNSLLGQRVSGYEDTVLHLATRLGHTELVSEIIGLSREMVSSENFRRETPLHIACFNGNFEIVKLLLAVDPWVASRLDCENQSSTFLACINGHLDAAELCLQQPGVVPFEETKAALCLRVTIAKGFTGIYIYMYRFLYAYVSDPGTHVVRFTEF